MKTRIGSEFTETSRSRPGFTESGSKTLVGKHLPNIDLSLAKHTVQYIRGMVFFHTYKYDGVVPRLSSLYKTVYSFSMDIGYLSRKKSAQTLLTSAQTCRAQCFLHELKK
jgi:hypothetical protein